MYIYILHSALCVLQRILTVALLFHAHETQLTGTVPELRVPHLITGREESWKPYGLRPVVGWSDKLGQRYATTYIQCGTLYLFHPNTQYEFVIVVSYSLFIHLATHLSYFDIITFFTINRPI